MRRSSAFFFVIILGVIAVIVGVSMGANSHQITFQKVEQGTIAHYLSSEGSGYLQMDGSDTLYTVNENDFTPAIHGIQTLANGDHIAFNYSPTDTTHIDKTSTLGTHLVGNAFKIVEITLFDTNGQTDFTTAEFKDHPNGYMQNNWPTGGVLILIGLACVVGSFFLPKRNAQTGFSVTPNNMMGVPPGMQQPPYQPGPYAQPNQYGQPNQYPQSTPYTPQPGPYDPQLPANPYAQPQQPQYPPYQVPPTQYPQQQPPQYPPYDHPQQY